MREQRSFVLLQVQNSGDVTVNDAICRCASVAKGNLVQVFLDTNISFQLALPAVVLFSTECKFQNPTIKYSRKMISFPSRQSKNLQLPKNFF